MTQFPPSVRSVFEFIREGTAEVLQNMASDEGLIIKDGELHEQCIGILNNIWEAANDYVQATELTQYPGQGPKTAHHVATGS